ncbi:superoxide dismutase family protein [Bdellovibrio sp. SKB1291214]|uniref:superoxide dismutase family protein n=1 Tax=Bdellovibrio sp. SKB1291214 TaxID=1732569 RepID=UPI000B51DE0D|nr:superoxide dismutase family protein [Bdellovibrio sp. SKB1291214]UYL10317.1 superoxide dismutase family protein [Bdellovibrio sp. SKB1291214]
MKRYLAPVLAALVIGACAHKEEAPVAPAAPPPPPPPTQAHAVLKAAKGSKIAGTIHFTEANGEITVKADVTGLKKGSFHGFHIHEVGTCEGDFSSAGGHFNPTGKKHGSPTAEEKHVGDLGNVKADKKGVLNTTITLKAPLNGPEGIIGKSIIIHKGKDDLKSQPAGNSGPREACGIIEAM